MTTEEFTASLANHATARTAIGFKNKGMEHRRILVGSLVVDCWQIAKIKRISVMFKLSCPETTLDIPPKNLRLWLEIDYKADGTLRHYRGKPFSDKFTPGKTFSIALVAMWKMLPLTQIAAKNVYLGNTITDLYTHLPVKSVVGLGSSVENGPNFLKFAKFKEVVSFLVGCNGYQYSYALSRLYKQDDKATLYNTMKIAEEWNANNKEAKPVTVPPAKVVPDNITLDIAPYTYATAIKDPMTLTINTPYIFKGRWMQPGLATFDPDYTPTIKIVQETNNG